MHPQSSSDRKIPGRQILIVEDEWLIAASLKDELERAGYEVIGPVSNVAAARELMQTSRPSAAILDISLGGIETTFPLARDLNERGIPFLFISGYTEDDLPAEFVTAPRMTKPMMSEALPAAIESLFAR
jgi:DNA-binding response OmpR family regulator